MGKGHDEGLLFVLQALRREEGQEYGLGGQPLDEALGRSVVAGGRGPRGYYIHYMV